MPESNGQSPRLTSSTRRARPDARRGGILGVIDASLERVADRPSLVVQLWHVVLMVVMGARKAQIPRMAAALSYRTIFGLIPVLVVSFIFLAAFSSQEVMTARVHDIMKFAGLTEISLNQPAGDESAVFEATSSTPLDQWIEGLVNRVRKLPPGALSIIGVATLIYAAISMLIEIEMTFNQIYMAPGGRTWVRRVVQYWALLTLGTIGLVATFAAQEAVLEFVRTIRIDYLTGAQTALVWLMQLLLPAVVSTMLLVFVYMTVPNTRVKFVPAVTGAILASILWEGCKIGIRIYAEKSVGYSTLYGPLALLPLFLLWVYVTWIIVLCGLQVAHALQTYSTAKAQGLTRSVLATLGLVSDAAEARRSLVVDPASALVLMVAAAERFRLGKASEHSALFAATGIDERVISEMLERLAGAGLLHRISGGEEDGSYSLSRPPEAIPAGDVLRVGEELSAVDRERAPKLLGDLAEARARTLSGKTLADMMGPAAGAAVPSTPGPRPGPAAATA